MASSLRHFISDKAVAAASLVRRRISLPQIRGCSSSSTKLAVPQRVSSPWLMLQPALKEDDDEMLQPSTLKKSGGAGMDHFNFYNLAQQKVVSFKKQSESPDDDNLLVGSSHGWLALHNRRNDRIFLSNPITGENIKLPSTLGSVEKVILSCDPHDRDCRAVASFNGSRLAFCSPVRSSQWTAVPATGSELPYSDLAYSTAEGLFLGVKNTKDGYEGGDENEDLEAWDATDPSSPKIRWMDRLGDNPYHYPFPRPKTPWHCNTLSYLVYAQDADKLLLVRRYVCYKYHNTYEFDVYAIERGRRELVLMDSSLDGLALFVGPNHSLAVRAAGCPELKAGSIYYTGSLLAVIWPHTYLYDIYGGNDIGIFDCSNRTIYNCYYEHDQYWSIHRICPPPLWFTPSPLY